MKSFALRHGTIATWIAFSLLAGCGGTHTALPNAPVVSPAAPTGYAARDLVYHAGYSEVEIYGYPDGKHVKTLTGYNKVPAVCTDRHGNVWVINEDSGASSLLEYAHGGSQPIASLHLSVHGADACAVDPSTGNLAVGTTTAKVAIWKKAHGSPAVYSTGAFVREVRTMTYDGAGNLYMRSFVGTKAAWLPKGGSSVMLFDVAQRGAYAWDGRHLVITGRASAYRLPLTLYKLEGAKGKIVGHVSLDECDVFYYRDYGPALSIAGSAAAISCGLDETAVVYYYKYPAGGKPINGVYGIAGSVAISVPSP